jgi:hypothetical protein
VKIRIAIAGKKKIYPSCNSESRVEAETTRTLARGPLSFSQYQKTRKTNRKKIESVLPLLPGSKKK